MPGISDAVDSHHQAPHVPTQRPTPTEPISSPATGGGIGAAIGAAAGVGSALHDARYGRPLAHRPATGAAARASGAVFRATGSCAQLDEAAPPSPKVPAGAAPLTAGQASTLLQPLKAALSELPFTHVMPASAQVVVLDVESPLGLAFVAARESRAASVLLWDAGQARFVGLLTVADYIGVLLRCHGHRDEAESIAASAVSAVRRLPWWAAGCPQSGAAGASVTRGGSSVRSPHGKPKTGGFSGRGKSAGTTPTTSPPSLQAVKSPGFKVTPPSAAVPVGGGSRSSVGSASGLGSTLGSSAGGGLLGPSAVSHVNPEEQFVWSSPDIDLWAALGRMVDGGATRLPVLGAHDTRPADTAAALAGTTAALAANGAPAADGDVVSPSVGPGGAAEAIGAMSVLGIVTFPQILDHAARVLLRMGQLGGAIGALGRGESDVFAGGFASIFDVPLEQLPPGAVPHLRGLAKGGPMPALHPDTSVFAALQALLDTRADVLCVQDRGTGAMLDVMSRQDVLSLETDGAYYLDQPLAAALAFRPPRAAVPVCTPGDTLGDVVAHLVETWADALFVVAPVPKGFAAGAGGQRGHARHAAGPVIGQVCLRHLLEFFSRGARHSPE